MQVCEDFLKVTMNNRIGCRMDWAKQEWMMQIADTMTVNNNKWIPENGYKGLRTIA